MTPVELLYAIPVPALSEVEPSLPLKVDQSDDVRTPLFVALAEGRLNVMVWPDPVIVKSLPVVDVAKRTEPEVTCWPVGPIAEMSEDADGRQVPLTE